MDIPYWKYLMLLSSEAAYYNDELDAPMEQPESPKFNVTLWQPWLLSFDQDKCGESTSPGSAPNTRAAAAKQLPTAKWKRDRRTSTRLPDYKPRDGSSNGGSKAASRSNSFKEQPIGGVDCVDGPARNLARTESAGKGDLTASGVKCDAEIPIDMSLSGKPRGSPPPYSEAVVSRSLRSPPGRPSVIARAAAAPTNAQIPTSIPGTNGSPASLSMCDPVIDEHFRRSLGADYMALFSNRNNNNYPQPTDAPVSVDRGSSPILFASDPCTKYLILCKDRNVDKSKVTSPTPNPESKITAVQMEIDDGAGLSVDDHFAKALGDTWKKLQENQQKPSDDKPQTAKENSNSSKSDSSSSKILSRRGVVI